MGNVTIMQYDESKVLEFIGLVAKMRKAQLAYFDARRKGLETKPYLIAAQRLERDTDRALRWFDPPEIDPQAPLFDDEGLRF